MEGQKDLASHWNNAYKRSSIEKLGWHEEYPEPSLRLIEKCRFNKDAMLLNVGAGATNLVRELINRGFTNIIANDISHEALDELKGLLGTESKKVKWIIDDLTQPTVLKTIEKVDLWHDRAVMHFFTDKKEQNTYFTLLKNLLKPKGFAIIAGFNLNGSPMCSGLRVHRYDKKMLVEQMGSDFELIENFDFTYTMPSGDTREYIYTLFRKK